MGVTAADFDNDGWDDIYVANDRTENFLFHNKHDGTFEESGERHRHGIWAEWRIDFVDGSGVCGLRGARSAGPVGDGRAL